MLTKREELKICGAVDLVSTNHIWVTLHRDVIALSNENPIERSGNCNDND